MYNKLEIVFDSVKNLQNMAKHDGLSLAKAIEFEWGSALTWRKANKREEKRYAET